MEEGHADRLEIMSASRAALKASDNQEILSATYKYLGSQAPIDSGYNTTTGNDEDAGVRDTHAQALRTLLASFDIILAPSDSQLHDEPVAEFVEEMKLRLKIESN